MSLLEAFRSALSALRGNLFRALLTMLGIVIGVAAVIAMVALGSGAREQVVAQIRSLGSNLLIVFPGNITTGGIRLGAGQSSALTDEDARAIEREIPSVQVTAPYLRTTSQVIAANANWATAIYGIDDGWFETREWPVELGREFSPDELSRGAQVALLGRSVARNLFGEADPVGETIRLRNVPFQVIGVMGVKGQSTQGQDQDDAIFVPFLAARQRLVGINRANARSVSTIMIKVREGESMDEAQEQIIQLLRQRHRIQPGQDDDFTVRNLSEIAATREASARALALLLAAVATVSLVVGGIGIMNIMLVSVTERTREIGLRLAVGARRRDIRTQFLIEATTLSAIGGIIGIALGIGAAVIVANTAGWPLLIEPSAILIAVAFSGLVGIFFGFYPAKRASDLDPIEALRAN